MSLLRKGIFAGGGSVACLVLGVLTNMMLARALGPDGMGRYQLPIQFGMLLATFLSFGIGQANIYSINKLKMDISQVVQNSLWISILLGIFFMITVPIILSVFSGYFGELSFFTNISIAIGVASTYAIAMMKPILTARLQIKRHVYVRVTQPVFFLIATVLYYFSGNMTAAIVIILASLTKVSSVLLLLWYLKDKINFGVNFSWKVFCKCFSYGLRLFSANIVYTVNASIGLLILRYMKPDEFEAIGLYGRGCRLAQFILLVPLAVGPLLYANWASLKGEKRDRQIELSMRMYIAACALMILGLVLFGKWALLVLYGADFLPALPVLRIMTFGVTFRCLFSVPNALFLADGRANTSALILTGSLVMVVLLSWVLIPIYGISGAAWAETISAGLTFTISLFILKKNDNIKLGRMIILTRCDIRKIVKAVLNK